MTDTISTSTISRIKFPIKQKEKIRGKLTKNEQLLEKSNFHLLRAYQEKKRLEDEKKAVEQKFRRRSTIRGSTINDMEDISPSHSPSDKAGSDCGSPILPSIREQARRNYEAKKFVRFVDNGGVELISPSSRGVVRIKDCKVPISSSDIRLDELRHID